MITLLTEPTHPQQLIVFVAYSIILGLVLWLSVAAIGCHLHHGTDCYRRRFGLKLLLGGSLVLTCLGLLAFAVLLMALHMHGPAPTGKDLLMALAATLIPAAVIIAWMIGSRIANGIVALVLTVLLLYLVFIRPDFAIRLFAENDVVIAQKWMAQEEPGRDWMRRAAQQGDVEAQYLAGLESARRYGSSAGNGQFRKAAEQGHTDAMIELAKHGDTTEEREHWLEAAFARRHPEALAMKASRLLASDLPEARRLLQEAAEGGSPTAMLHLASEHAGGGILFDQDTTAAERWLHRARKAMREADRAQEYDLWYLNAEMNKRLKQGRRMAAGDTDALFRTADEIYRSHRADEVAKQRALRYFEQAALKGHGEAAYRVGRHYGLDNTDPAAAKTAREWYGRGADAGHIPAMGELARYYSGDDPDHPRDLQRAMELGERMVETIRSNPEQKVDQRKWYAIYLNIRQQYETVQEQGGTLQQLETGARQDTHQKFLYGKALLGKEFARGRKLIREAADAGDQEARFHFAQTTLRQPRTTQQRIDAITFLQQLAGEGYAPAYTVLAREFRDSSASSALPLNDYLAYRLFRQAGEEPVMRSDEKPWGIPLSISELDLEQADDPLAAIQAWYERHRTRTADPERLETNYRNLMTHYQDAGPLRARAERGDAASQYRYAYYLLGRDLGQAFAWMEKAADNGLADAQYEVAYRLLNNNRNAPELYAKAVRHLEAAAAQQHAAAKGLLAFYYSGKHDYLRDRVKPDHDRARQLYREVLDSTEGEFVYTSDINGKATPYRRDRMEARLAELAP